MDNETSAQELERKEKPLNEYGEAVQRCTRTYYL